VHRLLTYDPDQVGTLHEVIMEMEAPPAPEQDPVRLHSPVRLLFARAFRHVWPVLGELKRGDKDAVVDELIERLDRHKGDTAFVNAWEARYGAKTGTEVAAALRSILVLEGGQ
jgi:hypothetical protein